MPNTNDLVGIGSWTSTYTTVNHYGLTKDSKHGQTHKKHISIQANHGKSTPSNPLQRWHSQSPRKDPWNSIHGRTYSSTVTSNYKPSSGTPIIVRRPAQSTNGHKHQPYVSLSGHHVEPRRKL